MSGYGAKSSKFPSLSPGLWSNYAICKEVDPEVFFPERNNRRETRLAIDICKTCPVIAECLDHALRVQQDSSFGLQGIWGGTSEYTRKEILRRKVRSVD